MILRGRTILITGGSAGIGLAFALKFVELGNEVIVTGRRKSVLEEVKKRHPKLHTFQSDVADPAQIATLATRVKLEFPKLDVLMNNAGIMLHKNLTAPTADLAGLMTEMNGYRDQYILGSRVRAVAICANLQRHQSRDPLLHPVATVSIGGNRRGGHRAHATGGEDRLGGRHHRG